MQHCAAEAGDAHVSILSLYSVAADKKQLGDAWKGPSRYYPHGEWTVIAHFPALCVDGVSTTISTMSMPSKFYRLTVSTVDPVTKKSRNVEISTNSASDNLPLLIDMAERFGRAGLGVALPSEKADNRPDGWSTPITLFGRRYDQRTIEPALSFMESEKRFTLLELKHFVYQLGIPRLNDKNEPVLDRLSALLVDRAIRLGLLKKTTMRRHFFAWKK